MKDLAKKLYWLIFSGSISLFFILLSSLSKSYESFPITQFFKYDTGKWYSEIDTTLSRMHKRIDALNEISDTLKNFNNLDVIFFYKNYKNSLKYDKIIKFDLARITSFLNSIENNDRLVMGGWVLDFEFFQKLLNKEIELWNYLGSKSVNIIYYFRHDVDKINKFEFNYNFQLRRSSLESYAYTYTEIHKEGILRSVLFPVLKSTFFLVALILDLYLIVFLTLPIGIEIWLERKYGIWTNIKEESKDLGTEMKE